MPGCRDDAGSNVLKRPKKTAKPKQQMREKPSYGRYFGSEP